jgi:hypothetical protein
VGKAFHVDHFGTLVTAEHAWFACFQLIPEFVPLLPTIDPNNTDDFIAVDAP